MAARSLPQDNHCSGASGICPHCPACVTYADTQLGRHRHAVRIGRYENGDEEFNDHETTPYEHNNLATLPEHTALKEHLATHFPKTDVPEVPRSK